MQHPRYSSLTRTLLLVVGSLVSVACGEGGATMMAHPDAPPGTPDAPPVMLDASAPVVPEVIAENQVAPRGISAFAGEVFWVNEGVFGQTNAGQLRKATAGGTVQTLVPKTDQPSGVVAGAGFVEPTVFWIAGGLLGELRQIAATGAPPTSIISVQDVPYDIALAGDHVFVGTRSTLYSKLLTNTSGLTTLAGGYANGVTAIAADATRAYFGARTTSGSWIVASVPRAGGTVTNLATGTAQIRDLAVDATHVYWLRNDQLLRVALTGGETEIVKTFTFPQYPWALAIRDGKVFVATNQGVINPTGATGQIIAIDAVTKVATVLATDQAEPSAIAVDSAYVYWTNLGLSEDAGEVMKIAR